MIDSYTVSNSNNSYELVNCESVSDSQFVSDSNSCVNVYYSDNLQNCSECIACSSLKNKKYCVFNKEYDKETYFEIKKLLLSGSFTARQKLYEKYKNFTKGIPKKFIHEIRTENVSGDYIFNSKNVHNSFEIDGAENVRHSQMLELPQVTDSMDYSNWGDGASLVYEAVNSGSGLHSVKFCVNCLLSVSNTEYSLDVFSSSNVFASVSVKKGQNIILNKEYSEKEFLELKEKIIKDMNERPYIARSGLPYKYGEFFPPELSPFYANETVLFDYFPELDFEELANLGFKIKKKESRAVAPEILSKDLPDNIKDINSDIVGKIIECANANKNLDHCKRAFKITSFELDFYKKHNIPLPRFCPACREKDRLKRKNPWHLKKASCACEGVHAKKYKNKYEHKHGKNKCQNEFYTAYNTDKNIIYCKDCYEDEFE